MNDLCADIGYKSINHVGEQLCGDHVDIVEPDENSTVIVLSDGLGSGVKAHVLANMTTTMALRYLQSNMDTLQSVETIMDSLPVWHFMLPKSRNAGLCAPVRWGRMIHWL